MHTHTSIHTQHNWFLCKFQSAYDTLSCILPARSQSLNKREVPKSPTSVNTACDSDLLLQCLGHAAVLLAETTIELGHAVLAD